MQHCKRLYQHSRDLSHTHMFDSSRVLNHKPWTRRSSWTHSWPLQRPPLQTRLLGAGVQGFRVQGLRTYAFFGYDCRVWRFRLGFEGVTMGIDRLLLSWRLRQHSNKPHPSFLPSSIQAHWVLKVAVVQDTHRLGAQGLLLLTCCGRALCFRTQSVQPSEPPTVLWQAPLSTLIYKRWECFFDSRFASLMSTITSEAHGVDQVLDVPSRGFVEMSSQQSKWPSRTLHDLPKPFPKIHAEVSRHMEARGQSTYTSIEAPSPFLSPSETICLIRWSALIWTRPPARMGRGALVTLGRIGNAIT